VLKYDGQRIDAMVSLEEGAKRADKRVDEILKRE